MSSGVYTYALSELLKGKVDFLNDSISLIACSGSYSPDFSADRFQSDIPDDAFLSEALTSGATVTAGVYESNPVTFSDVAAGVGVAGFVLSKDTGFKATSPLIAFFSVTPFVSDGTEIVTSSPELVLSAP
jgi:hypothetical protein